MTMRVDGSVAQARCCVEAERLVVEGLRRWLAGYRTGDIGCWEEAWSLYAGALGVARARIVMAGLSGYARELSGWAKWGVSVQPYNCPCRSAHETLAVEAIAAWQRGAREAATGMVEELVVSNGLPAMLEATAFFADSLRRADLRLPSAVSVAPVVGVQPTHTASETRH